MNSKICIVAINYAPELTGCGPYTTDLAECLQLAGNEVTVITALPHYPQWNVPKEYRSRGRRSEILNGVQIIRCWLYVPKKMTAISRLIYEFSFLVMSWLKSRKTQADVVIAISPALGDMLVGHLIAKRSKASFGILVQDLMTAATTQSNISGGNKISKLAEFIESRYLKSATSVATITESFSRAVLKMGVNDSKIYFSPNYSVKNITQLNMQEARKIMNFSEDAFIITHTGNMGLKQDLGNLIHAVQLCKNPKIQLFLVGDGSQRSELEKVANQDSRIEFMDLVSEERYSALLSASNALIINEAPTVTDMSLPSKLTAYTSSGRPIIGAVVQGGNTSLALNQLSQARQVPAGNPQQLADLIMTFVDGINDLNVQSHESSAEIAQELRNQRILWVESLKGKL